MFGRNSWVPLMLKHYTAPDQLDPFEMGVSCYWTSLSHWFSLQLGSMMLQHGRDVKSHVATCHPVTAALESAHIPLEAFYLPLSKCLASLFSIINNSVLSRFWAGIFPSWATTAIKKKLIGSKSFPFSFSGSDLNVKIRSPQNHITFVWDELRSDRNVIFFYTRVFWFFFSQRYIEGWANHVSRLSAQAMRKR